MGAFGVELPDNLGEESTAPESHAESGAPESSPQKESESQEPQITDLASLERFRFGDKEWSRDDFQKFIADSESQRQVSEERQKFEENFPHDLAAVVKDPKRFAEFSQLYPREFVQRAEAVLRRHGLDTQPQPAPNTQNLDEVIKQFPALKPLLERVSGLEGTVKSYEQAQKDLALEKTQAWLDKHFDTFSKKYPDADPRLVNLALHEVAKKGAKVTEQVIEKAFKKDHDERLTRWEAKYKSKVEEQKNANFKGRDMGAGGQTPAAAPQTHRTLKEAKAALLGQIEASA